MFPEVQDADQFAKQVQTPCNSLDGNSLPVSAFVPGGRVPCGTSQYEKRGIAINVACLEALLFGIVTATRASYMPARSVIQDAKLRCLSWTWTSARNATSAASFVRMRLCGPS